MITEERARILSNFFLDGAKILFASLVVGAFVPGTVGVSSISPPSVIGGFISTAAFLGISMKITKS